MATLFTNYHDAARAARKQATGHGLDVAIRKIKSFGTTQYAVSFASVNDSDYARAEIVRPNEPEG